MNELTLEALAKRVEALERLLHVQPAQATPKDWRAAVGMFSGSDFMKQIDAEGRAIVSDIASARDLKIAAIALANNTLLLTANASEENRQFACGPEKTKR